MISIDLLNKLWPKSTKRVKIKIDFLSYFSICEETQVKDLDFCLELKKPEASLFLNPSGLRHRFLTDWVRKAVKLEGDSIKKSGERVIFTEIGFSWRITVHLIIQIFFWPFTFALIPTWVLLVLDFGDELKNSKCWNGERWNVIFGALNHYGSMILFKFKLKSSQAIAVSIFVTGFRVRIDVAYGGSNHGHGNFISRGHDGYENFTPKRHNEVGNFSSYAKSNGRTSYNDYGGYDRDNAKHDYYEHSPYDCYEEYCHSYGREVYFENLYDENVYGRKNKSEHVVHTPMVK
ncbi:hypothetical protein M9H77_22698 [Catharanthus roseus]|uniref:Uncharacterized protein n=1 Tax=Catharanthus roseus TaxID=4058 RepID=A0ACC0ASN9_CATRO|nr:hypothetical protein M9H77_22698 [Catharanthus roseus]